MGGGFAEV